MDNILGLDAKLYHNTGTYALPTWAEIEDAQDVSLNLEAGEAEAKRRGSGGWAETIAALKEASIEFGLLYRPSDPDFGVLRDAYLNRTAIDLLVLDGDVATSGSQGLRAVCHITNFSREEPLEEAVTISVTAKPTPNSDSPPVWFTAP
ncbi:MAG: phage tail tube protein [Planctomycetaceae bacterium]